MKEQKQNVKERKEKLDKCNTMRSGRFLVI